MQHPPEYSTPMAADEVTIKSLVVKAGNARRYLLTKWKVLLLAIIIGGAAGVAYAMYKKPVYTAENTFVLDDGSSSGGGLGQYTALASAFGIDLGGSGGGLFQGDNIIQLYQSRHMVENALLTKASFNGKQKLLVDRYIALTKMREGWSKQPKLKNISFDIPRERFTIAHDSIMSRIIGDITKTYLTVSKPDKKLSIISVKVKSGDELFAKAFSESIVNTVNTFYVQTRTKGSIEVVQLLQHQADSLRRTLNSSLAGTAAAADYNPNPNPAMQILRVPAQRRQIDVQSTSAIYAEVIKNLTIARGSLQRQTPLIQIIDQPILPLPKEAIGRSKAGLIGMFLAELLCIVGLITYKFYKNLMS